MVQLDLDSRRLAENYDELSDYQFDNGRCLLELLDIKPNARVLDIGCGTGRLGLHVAEKLNSDGRYVGIDPLEERIRIANSKRKPDNVHFHVGVAEDLSYLDCESFDVVFLSAVFHWIVAKDKALREISRVLKPGGRLGFTTGAKELSQEATFRKITDRVLLRPPYNKVVDLDNYVAARHGVTTTQLVELLLKARLGVQNVEIRKRVKMFTSGREIVDFLEASTFGNYLYHVPITLQDGARKEIIKEFDTQKSGGQIEFTGYTIFAVAEKPLVD
jgi:ubiquinone/menaquinone biosynthesis C-methylase UbiE